MYIIPEYYAKRDEISALLTAKPPEPAVAGHVDPEEGKEKT